MSILAFLAVFALTIVLQQWLHRHIQGFAFALTGNPGCALRLLFYLLLPGIYLHEASHYIAAKILIVDVRKFNVGIGNSRKKQVSLGSVQIARSDPFRESLIGAAPFIVGITAIWLIVSLGFGVNAANLSMEQWIARVGASSHDWTTWAFLYLIFAVSTAMIPSESDREPWGLVLIVAGVLISVLLLLGWMPRVPPDLVSLARHILDALTFSLSIAVGVNGIVAAALWILERTVERISGKRVEYRTKK
jgi:hypothetical protein